MIAMQQQPRMNEQPHFQSFSTSANVVPMDCMEEDDQDLLPREPEPSQNYSPYNMADPQEVQRVREKTKELLIVCVQAHCCTEARTTNKAKCVQEFVRRLEQALFDTAPTLPDYANPATLPMRVAILLPRIKQDFQRTTNHVAAKSRKQQQQSSSSSCRRLEQLVATIRQERQALVGASCPKCVRQREGNAILPGQASFGSQLDPPVARLFFQTPLVEYLDAHYPSPDYPWSEWEGQAEAHLQAFYEWKAQHYVCER